MLRVCCRSLQNSILSVFSASNSYLFLCLSFFIVSIYYASDNTEQLENFICRDRFKYENNIAGTSFEKNFSFPLPIDIVFTWVNGTDPKLIKDLKDLKDQIESDDNVSDSENLVITRFDKNETENLIAQNRFADNNELKYSLRSVEKYAPWIRHIYIVTNGQVPYWLDIENPHITIVTHEEIFANKSHLPSFSSPGIESHIHRIPGLSQKFIYMNDDVLFTSPVWPDDFITPNSGQKIYVSWGIPGCVDGCPNNWLGDGYCDITCNCTECDFDFGDCANQTGIPTNLGGLWNSPNSISCSPGCPVSWVGDRYCDNLCQNENCGNDASDCGLDLLRKTVYSNVLTDQLLNQDKIDVAVPDGKRSMYFNITAKNITLTNITYDNSNLISHAIANQVSQVITILFKENKTMQSTEIMVSGQKKTGEEISNFTCIISLQAQTLNISTASDKDREQEIENLKNLIRNKVVVKIQKFSPLKTAWANNNNNNNNNNNSSSSSSSINNNDNADGILAGIHWKINILYVLKKLYRTKLKKKYKR